MKTLNLNQLESIHGGGQIAATISGACAAFGIATALKLLVVSRTALVVVAVGCAVNGAGGSFGWW